MAKGQATLPDVSAELVGLIFGFCGFFESVADILNVLANALDRIARREYRQHKQKSKKRFH